MLNFRCAFAAHSLRIPERLLKEKTKTIRRCRADCAVVVVGRCCLCYCCGGVVTTRASHEGDGCDRSLAIRTRTHARTHARTRPAPDKERKGRTDS